MCLGRRCHHGKTSFKKPWSPPLFETISLIPSINSWKVQFEGSMTITPELKWNLLFPLAATSGILNKKSRLRSTRRSASMNMTCIPNIYHVSLSNYQSCIFHSLLLFNIFPSYCAGACLFRLLRRSNNVPNQPTQAKGDCQRRKVE